MDDSDLLSAYLDERSEAAFAELVNRYLKLTYSAALRQVGDAHLAKDAVQMVFIELARKARTLRDRKVLAGWLYTSIHYKVIQIIRAEARRKVRERKAELMSEFSDEKTDAWSHLRPVIDATMLELKESDREVLLLRFFEGNRYPEIAEKLSLPENTVRMRVERALKKMHALLARRGVKSTTAAFAILIAEQAVGAAPAGLASEVTGAALAGATTSTGILAQAALSTKVQFAIGSAVLAAGGFLFVQGQANQRLRDEADRLNQEIHRTSLELADVRGKLKGRVEKPSRPREQEVIAAEPAAAPADFTQTAEYHRMMLRARSSLSQRYGTLLRALKLDPEKEGRLEALLLDQFLDEEIALHNLSYGYISGASADNAKMVDALKTEVAKEGEERIHLLLGDALFARYASFSSTLPVRGEVEETAAAFQHTAAALRDDEIERLVAFVARAGIDVTRPLPDALMTDAALLDSNQRSALAQLQAVRIARRKILVANRDAAAKGLVHLPHVPGAQLAAEKFKP